MRRENKAKSIKHKEQKRFAFLRSSHAPRLTLHVSGNFLLQALLAITLIIAFMPLLARKIATQAKNAEIAATAAQLETAATAARLFVQENSDRVQFGETTVSGESFSDLLEPFGLPLGFIPKTPLSQDISLVILRDSSDMLVMLEVKDGKLSNRQRADLAARIGFWAALPMGDNTLSAAGGEWHLDTSEFGFRLRPDSIYIRVPDSKDFSELVRRSDKDSERNKFLTDMDMGKFSMRNAGAIFSMAGKFNSVQADSLSLFGLEDGRKLKNNFAQLSAAKASFQGGFGESALAVTKGILTAESLSAKTISGFGDAGNLTADVASVYEFTMSAGRSGFTGPPNWDVRENMITENISMNLERLEIGSFINASRGQDVYLDENDFSYSPKSGIETYSISASNITVRDQISSALAAGSSGSVLLDIRVAGTSILPDVWLTGINNGDMEIIADAHDSSGKTTDCRSVINTMSTRAGLGFQVSYNQSSLMQNIVCQYVFWQRLEKRIDIKKCLLEGKSGC